VLGYHDVGLLLVFRIVGHAHEVRTVDEDDHIGILLDGAGFAKVAQLGLAGAAGALHCVSGKL
jgi:hypothetical protein